MNFFNRNKKKGASYQGIVANQYQSEFMQAKHMLVDVRTQGEFNRGHAKGAINIPLNELSNRVSELTADQPIVVICASGNRSRSGANIIAKAGFDKVYNFNGGTMAWMSAGLPVNK
jgi:rhodanese-related sulfurtransferase